MAKAALGANDIDIDIDGETVTLRFTLAADQAISRAFGGPIPASRALADFNIDTIAGLIAIGADLKPNDVAAKVWRNKMQLVAPLQKYLLGFIEPPSLGGDGEGNPPAS